MQLPSIKDGLTQKQRVVLFCLQQLQKERNGRNVPSLMLYGRVVEHVDMGTEEFQNILQHLLGVNASQLK
ncbi:hypothetical protein [Agarilytica rhodophyticola]|uniref:hypothetical protein n=1 Tax=Agarilytica rhodophyticola TaxID=1737490 RepID=UPI000B342952|nr:hypothetical protein [Agarilytica rhodophyticola]